MDVLENLYLALSPNERPPSGGEIQKCASTCTLSKDSVKQSLARACTRASLFETVLMSFIDNIIETSSSAMRSVSVQGKQFGNREILTA